MLVAAAAYELAIAVGAIGIGSSPGDGAPAETIVLIAALLALLIGCIWAIACSVSSRPGLARAPASMLAPAAVALLLARFYSYDAYYAPSLRRMSDGGLVAAGWVYALVAAALAAAVLSSVRRKAGLATTAPLLILVAVTALLENAGH